MSDVPGRPGERPAAGARPLRTSPFDLPADRLERRSSIVWGCLILLMRPWLAAQFEAGREPHGRHERSALHALTALYRRAGLLGRLDAQQVEFWSGPAAVHFHAANTQRFDRVFWQHHYTIIAELEKVIASVGVRQLCEIGCGSGQMLTHLAQRVPTLDRLVGLDLSDEQVRINRLRNQDPRIEYHDGDAFDWIAANAGRDWAFFCYGGVLEYFAQARLAALLALCAAQLPVVFALVEPLADDFDADGADASLRFGLELTLSHPYPRLLADAGFLTIWRSECRALGFRWLMLVAQRQESEHRLSHTG